MIRVCVFYSCFFRERVSRSRREEEEEKVRFEVAQTNRDLQMSFNGLVSENRELRKDISLMKEENLETQEELKQLSLRVKSLVEKPWSN